MDVLAEWQIRIIAAVFFYAAWVVLDSSRRTKQTRMFADWEALETLGMEPVEVGASEPLESLDAGGLEPGMDANQGGL